jgi:hypothetical protein
MQNKKLQQQQQQANPQAQWLNHSQQDKTSADYIAMITSDEGTIRKSGTHQLEAMVRAQLKKEFPNIENMNSYEFMVDAVMHNYMKKQLQATD